MRVAVLGAAALICGLAVTPGHVQAAISDELFGKFSEYGQGAGQIVEPHAVEVSPLDGHVFIGEAEAYTAIDNARVSEYTAWGEFVKAWGWGVDDGSPEPQVCTSSCERGIRGAGAGQLQYANGLAIDSAGDIYAFERDNLRVQKFSPDGEFILMWGGGVNQGPIHPGNVCTATHIAEGDDCGAGESGTGPGEFSIEDLNSVLGDYIDIAPDGTVYVGDKGRIQSFDLDGAYQGEFSVDSGYTGPGADNPGSLAVDPVSEDIYFAFNQPSSVLSQTGVYRFSAAGALEGKLPIKKPEALASGPDGELFAVEGTYGGGSDSHPDPEVIVYDADGTPIIPIGSRFATPPDDSGVRLLGLGTNPLGDLYLSGYRQPPAAQPEAGEAYIEAYGPAPVAYEDPPIVPPEISAQYATAVSATEASLRAEINPRYWNDTRFYVEYGSEPCSSNPCAGHPAPPGSVLSAKVISTSLKTSELTLTGLDPATTYHYRFVAQSTGGGPVVGADRSFTTPGIEPAMASCPGNQAFRQGVGERLPDCRAYEMVSPVDKEGADIEAVFNDSGYPARLNQAAESGNTVTYSAYRAFAGPVGAPYSSQYLSRRMDDGWESESISPPRAGPSFYLDDGLDLQFKGFTPDLASGWPLQDTEPTLATEGVAGFPGLYRRDNGSGNYEALSSVVPEDVDPADLQLELQGVSADGARSIFRSNAVLAPEGSKGRTQLYEARGGETELVCVRPSGAASKENCSAGTPGVGGAGRTGTMAGAMSSDGSIVYWTEALSGPGRMFVRIDGEQTVAVSPGLKAQFWAAARDGSSVIFSEDDTLYRFDLGASEVSEIASQVLGVAGASTDASVVYFVSTGELAGGAVAGEPNLYRRVGDEGTTFIATLSPEDISGIAPSPTTTSPALHAAQASADGSALAFMSFARPGLTGYDNTDVASGEADAEVYLFDADGDGGSGDLRCVSCLQSGARPSGRDVRGDLGVPALPQPVWAAALLPMAQTQLYTPRILAQDGSRLYFESFDGLVSSDTNSTLDVYQWEAMGRGSCLEGGPGYRATLGGCVSLISSGESGQRSTLVDSSPNGRDVFFLTGSSLVSQDPGLIDIYNAREGGGFAPPSGPAPECLGEACQTSSASPSPPTPSSESFVGPSNPKPKSKPKKCAKGKHKVKRKGKVRCVKNKKRKTKRHQRHSRVRPRSAAR